MCENVCHTKSVNSHPISTKSLKAAQFNTEAMLREMSITPRDDNWGPDQCERLHLHPGTIIGDLVSVNVCTYTQGQ